MFSLSNIVHYCPLLTCLGTGIPDQFRQSPRAIGDGQPQ